MVTPFAVEVYRAYLTGKSVEQLSRELHIPLPRIQSRVKAAIAYLASQQTPRNGHAK
jgi:hypothetical protein